MKFTVTHGPLNEVEVKLHWETKDKIKRIAYWTVTGVLTAAATAYLVSEQRKAGTEEE